MASNYDKIRDQNIKDYGRKTNHISYLGRLYSDRTHFIFELLQNAEDAGAKRVLFDLYKDKIIVKHDAERVFDEEDVQGICGVGEGTKEEDLNKIGTFGIGFKSVYAYTKSPEIHSGDEHFRIESYVRPYYTKPIVPSPPWTTLFVIKFDNEDLKQHDAFQKIAERLKNLSARTLLFLRSINEIEYEIERQKGGIYLREEEIINHTAKKITVIGQNNGNDDNEKWLVFKNPIETSNSKNSIFLEIAFKLNKNEKTNKESIQSINKSNLIVYFPTEKETKLGFLVQGPFKTTPARDNIPKDDRWNTRLINETATFLIEVLYQLRKMNLLNVEVLKALPVDPVLFPEDSMFYPIYVEVKKALSEKKFLPTNDKDYVSGKNAKLARASDLRKLFHKNHLEQLFEAKHVNWLDGSITENKTPILRQYLLEELSVEIIEPINLARKISKDFLVEQTDQWITEFYEFYESRRDAWRDGKKWSYFGPGPLRNKPIIRLEDGSHVEPFKKDGTPNAYLPSEFSIDTEFPTVKSVLIEKSKIARQFLTELGIPEHDIVEEVLQKILPKYNSKHHKVGENEHEKDIEAIVRAYKTDSSEKKKRLKCALRKSSFIRSIDSFEKNKSYYRATELYINSNELVYYFFNNNSHAQIADFYSQEAYELFKEIGLIFEIPVLCKAKNDTDKHIDLERNINLYRRGLSGFDADIEVTGLKEALENPSVEASQIIWNKIVIRYSHCIRGEVVVSSRQDFSSHARTYNVSEEVSEFGKMLINNSWLPGPDHNFYKPGELKLSELPSNLKKEIKLIKLLGMKSNASAKLAEEIGVEEEDLEILRNYREDFLRWKASLKKRIKPEFPERASLNPARRKGKIAEQIESAPNKEFQKRERNLRINNNSPSAKILLRHLYTNDSDQLICQICKDEMPFRKRDNQHYFEAVEAFTNDHLKKEHNTQKLALCPLCAAKYREFIHKDEKSSQEFLNSVLNTDKLEIPIKLGNEKTTVRFVETHLMDLTSLLEHEL